MPTFPKKDNRNLACVCPNYRHFFLDFSNYNNGKKGGKIRVRSAIDILDKKTLSITTVPYGITTQSLIESILKANNVGKIKIKKIEDNTAENVNIIISDIIILIYAGNKRHMNLDTAG